MIIKPNFCDSEKVLDEYPRPQLVRDSYLSLNGTWDYAISNKEDVDLYDGEIIVPYSVESELSGVKKQLGKNEFLIYHRNFYLNPDFIKDKVLLNIGACDQICTVYINGLKVGFHEGGYLSFSFDISQFIHPQDNDIKIVVSDDADSDVYGRGKQRYKRGGIWYTATSGLWQSVWIESVPKNYIESIKITPDLDNKNVRIIAYSDSLSDVKLSIKINDEEKEYVGKANEEIIVDASLCKLWCPDNPELYPFSLKLGDDYVQSYFGLRKFSISVVNGNKYFALNNEPIFYNGLLDQGYFEKGFYTPKSNKVMFDELLAVKELGYNMLRKHIKVESNLWYYYCDILGIVVFQDMINSGKQYKQSRINLGPFINLHLNDHNYKSMGRDNLRSREFWLIESKGLINQLYNYPCIALWTIFNEAWGQFDARENYEILKGIDNTRLYDVTSGWQDKYIGDVCSRHIYFMNINIRLPFSKIKNRVHAVTEFGGFAFKLYSSGEKTFAYKSFKSIEDYTLAYEKLYRKEVFTAIKKHHISATIYTQLTDVEDEINGILTKDRKLKINKEHLISLNKDLKEFFSKTISTFN